MVTSHIHKQINNYVKMNYLNYPFFYPIATEANYQTLCCGMSVNVVTFEPRTSQVPRQITTTLTD